MNGVFYCRLHEHLHLRISEEAEALNLIRLGHGLEGTPEGCWLWPAPTNDGRYGLFVPEGANTAQWLTHRVAWGLLMGGHKPGLQLDHRTCKRPNCANPLHLEPVTPSVNQQRKRNSPGWGWINPDAKCSPRVTQFAKEHRLPLTASATPTHPQASPPGHASTGNPKGPQCPAQLPQNSPTPENLTCVTTATVIWGSAPGAHHKGPTDIRMVSLPSSLRA